MSKTMVQVPGGTRGDGPRWVGAGGAPARHADRTDSRHADYRSISRHVDGVEPMRIRERAIILQERKKVNLVNVHRMEFAAVVHDSPVLVSADLRTNHRLRIRRIFLTIDIEAFVVL